MHALEDQARSLFLSALDRPPDEWPAYPDAACGGDPELRVRVEHLLGAHAAMGSIHGGTDADDTVDAYTVRPGTVIGPYRLMEEIGEGGMGLVFVAEQSRPVHRRVALRVVKPGMDTLPFLNRHVRGLVEFQRLTGCRPGEACSLRWCDIDTTAAVWVYTPPHHKMSYRGRPRVIAIGPQAQKLLAGFPTAAPEDYVFSPRGAVAERNAARAANRKTKYYHSRQGWQKRKAEPKRAAGERYTAASYGHAIKTAVRKANERRARLANGGRFDAVPAWHPNQLRHLRATEARKAFGLEAAQVLLGHAKADVTQIYAEKDADLAATVAAAIG
jgi:hypothetical protein